MRSTAPTHFPLRDVVHGVDVGYPLDSVQIALVHRVHANVAGASSGLGWPTGARQVDTGVGRVLWRKPSVARRYPRRFRRL